MSEQVATDSKVYAAVDGLLAQGADRLAQAGGYAAPEVRSFSLNEEATFVPTSMTGNT
jgi:hypothetical protein